MARWVETSWFRWSFKEKHENRSSEVRQYKRGVWDRNYWSVEPSSVKEALEELSAYCDEHQYEIKSVMPLHRAQSYEYGQVHSWAGMMGQTGGAGHAWGLGQGWGITMTDGFMAVLQRIEDLSQEEFDRRMAAREEQKRKAEEELKENERKVLKLEQEVKDAKGTIGALEVEIQEVKSSIEKAKQVVRELNGAVVDCEESNMRLQEYIDAPIEPKKGLLSKFKIKDKKFKSEDEAVDFKKGCKEYVEANLAKLEELPKQIAEEKLKLESLEELKGKQFGLIDRARANLKRIDSNRLAAKGAKIQ